MHNKKLVVQSNHFSTSKSAALSRYTHTILCRNNLFLISVLGNATVGLCWYICSVFSWKPQAILIIAAQDSPVTFKKKMLWIKPVMNRIAFLSDCCPHMHFRGREKKWVCSHRTHKSALIWYQVLMKPTVLLMRSEKISSPSCCSAPQTIQRSIKY